VVKISALGVTSLYCSGIFQIFVSVSGWVNPRAIVQSVQMKNPLTLGTDPITFQLVG
jgi:hypothetical protein